MAEENGTCRYPQHCLDHETNTDRISTMWGEKGVVRWVAISVLTAYGVMHMYHLTRAADVEKNVHIEVAAAINELKVIHLTDVTRIESDTNALGKSNIELRRSIDILAMNLRRLMEAQGVTYITPPEHPDSRIGG